MKNLNRVHHKGGKRRGFPQAQSKSSEPPAEAGQGSDVARGQQVQQSYVTILILEPSGREFCRFDLGSEVYAKMQALAQAQGITLAQLIDTAVEEKIARDLEVSARANNSEAVSSSSRHSAQSVFEQLRQLAFRNFCVEVNLPGIALGEHGDPLLAEFLAGVIDDNRSEICQEVLPRLTEDREVAELGDVLEIAKEINDWRPHLDKHGAAGVDIPRPLPERFALPGLAGGLHVAVGTVLFHLADQLHVHCRLILDHIVKTSDDIVGKVYLTEALAVAEAVIYRAGGKTELDASEEPLQPTTLQREAWKTRADHYRQWAAHLAGERRAA